jgi:hypothetical protein
VIGRCLDEAPTATGAAAREDLWVGVQS